jgi:hypothetical protein
MIISVSPSDPDIFLEIAVLANKYNEEDAVFDKDCFREIRQDTRVTFIGHGNRATFGDDKLTPEMFVANLMSFCPANILRSLKIIDLVGCGIGEVYEDESYVQAVAELLYKYGYADIKVNAFCNLVSREPITDIMLVTTPSGVGLKLFGLDAEAKKKFDRQLAIVLAGESLSKLKYEADALLEKKVAIGSQIRELKLSQKPNNAVINAKEIASLQSQLPGIIKDEKSCREMFNSARIESILEVHARLHSVIYNGDDIRRALDDNPAFHHSHAIFENLQLLSVENKAALIILNNHIADLKSALYKHENAYRIIKLITNFFWRDSNAHTSQSLEYPIAAFTKCRDALQNCALGLESAHLELSELLCDSRLDIQRNFIFFQEMLAVFSTDKESLVKLWDAQRKTISL